MKISSFVFKTCFFYKTNFLEDTMVGTLLDLFVAGAETTSTTLTFFFLYMAIFHEKQKKIQIEIDHVLGDRQVTLSDREK